ncbi:MAG: carboxypeptidase-like regulatory domain-containing protein, partial [Flavisolibacter sp.]
MKHFYTLLAFVFIGFAVQAQSSKITGTVSDEQGKPLPTATVSLFKSKDSSLVKLALSDRSGLYQFINIKDGNYFVAASSVGYQKLYSRPFEVKGQDLAVPSFSLKQAPASMSNVTVTARRP